jgi:hypothetical protein
MDAERYADIFARAATTGNRAELVKVASAFTKTALGMEDLKGALGNPAVQNALIGAGVGGLFGAATGKKKLRSALGYGLLGGLGGLGVSALTGKGKPEVPAGLSSAERGAIATGTGNPVAATATGAGIGGAAGYAAGGAVGDQMAKRENQLSRFMDAGGKDKHRFAKPLQRLEKFGPGGESAVADFKLDSRTAPFQNNRFRLAGLDTGNVGDEAGRAIDTVSDVMKKDRLSYLPWRRTKQLDALTKVIQAEGNAATRINPKALASALDELPAKATSRMPRYGRGAGALLGILLGGIGGARANRSAVLNAQQQAAGAQ